MIMGIGKNPSQRKDKDVSLLLHLTQMYQENCQGNESQLYLHFWWIFNLVLGCGTIGIEKDWKWKWSSYIFYSLQLYFMHLISTVSLFGMHWADNIFPILSSRKQLIEGGNKLGGDLSRYLELREKSISRCSRKTSISALLTMPKPLTMWITINCGKFWKRWEYQTTWPAFWEICMQVRK